jgi:exonuclease SbcD
VKILHTADWHLNDRLGRTDRTDHLRRRVEEVAGLCEREAVDVLVVAGDLFSEQAEVSARVNQVADSLRHLRRAFAPFFARGGIALAVTGNHDQDGRVRPHLEVARAGLDVTAPALARGGHFLPGKLYLLDTAFVGRVRDTRAGFDVQFALLPFPGLGRVLTGTETATTAAELNRPVAAAVAEWIRTLPEQPGYDPALRTVLVAHLNVTGADVGRGVFRMSEESDVILDAGALPTGFEYVALGHLHKPQCLRGLAHVRYSGSLDRMDFGERDEAKGVVIVDLGPDGRTCDPVFVPIEPTRLVDATITCAETAAEELAAQVPDPAAAVVRVTVEPAAAATGASVDLTIQATLANVSNVEWRPPAAAGDAAVGPLPSGSVRERVLNYLASRVAADDPQRADLLALAGTFLDQQGYQ